MAGPVADVAGDDFRVLEVQPGQLGTHLGHILVARSVEAVLADAVLVVVGVGQCVEVVHRRNRLVERGVEDGYLGRAGEHLLNREDTFEVGGVVQRGDVEQAADFLLDLLVDQAAGREELASVGHAVADGLHLVERGDDAVCGVRQCVEHQTDAGRVVGNRLVQLELLLADGLVGQVAFGQADTLDKAFREQLARRGLHVDDLILNRRGTAVQYQDYHIVVCFLEFALPVIRLSG